MPVIKNLRDDDLSALSRIVADTDVLWAPFRWNTGYSTAAAAISERRSTFPRLGVPFVVSSDRMAGERLLRGLQSRGLVRLHFSGKRRGVSLTEAGDDFARSFLPTQTVAESWPTLQRIAAVSSGNRFALEHDVLALPDDCEYLGDESRPFTDLEDFTLPLLARGFVESSSDTRGVLGYRLTAAGREALARGVPEAPVAGFKSSQAMRDEFIERYLGGLDERDAWRPLRRSLAWVPLAAGSWAPRQAEGTAS